MAENGGQSDEDLRKAASDSIRQGEAVRERVRELVLNALTSRRFDREAIRETVRVVTEGVSLAAEGTGGGTRHSVAEAFRGMDQALAKSVEAGQEAIRRILDTGRGISERELQQALAGLQKIEEDFVATVSQVAETAGERVAPELREVVGKATRAGTDTGRQVAAAMTELTRNLAGTSLKVTLAGIEVAGEFGVRFAQIAGGVLSGMAAALDKSSVDAKKNPWLRFPEPMLRSTLGMMRELPRLHEITSVLIRHGLGDFVQRIGIAGVLESAGRILRWGDAGESVKLDPPQRIRMAFEELGPAFVKLGQVMATRVDLFPPSWIAEFEKLQAHVPPVPFDEVLPELERALGRSPFEVFRDLETTALAAASIAQVHRAKLQDGTPVVLKIRRPGVRATIEADLRLLRRVAELVESEMPEARRYQPVEIAAQFTRSLEREIDFATETRNIERFAKNFAGDPHIVIPKVYPEWTSEALLVQEHIEGIPATDPAAVDAAGLDRKILAARGTQFFLTQILIHGFFHADPHPGNVIYLPDHRMVIIDFGMVGRLSPQRRSQVIDLLAGLARMEQEPMLDVLLDWAGDAYVDEAKLAADVNELVFEFEDVPLKSIRIGNVVRDFSAIVREHSIVLPSDLSMMFKALLTLEGLGRQYDPDVHVIEHLAPLLRNALDERYQPMELLRRGQGALNGFFNLLGSVPRDFARLLRDARRGKTRIDLDIKRLDQFGTRMERALNRGTVGVMTASLVIGSAIVMSVPEGPVLFGIDVLTAVGLTGYLLAFASSVWIIYGIWRTRRD